MKRDGHVDWKTLLAYVTGSVDERLLLRIEYLMAENRILRNQIKGGVHLSDAERVTLAEIGQRLGKKALEEVANIVKPATILGWNRKLVAQKFDGSKQRKPLGRPRVDKELEDLVVQMAKENRSWGYDRIVGALAHLGYDISDQTVGDILKRRGLPTAPDRKKTTTWKAFIRTHREVLWATDFFTTEVWTLGGLVTFYVLFFIKLDTREVHLAGVTPHPDEQWMMQVARNLTMDEWGILQPGQYLIHDRDTKFCAAFKQRVDDAGVPRLPLPSKSPNVNAIAERWIRSVKEETLSKMILFGERFLWHVLQEYVAPYHDVTARHHLYVARITGVEVIAAIRRRARRGDIAAPDVATALAQFRQDFAGLYHSIEITPTLVARAMTLAETQALRSYDAVQLAAAIEVNTRGINLGLPVLTLVSADGKLNVAATTEGLTVEDPNIH